MHRGVGFLVAAVVLATGCGSSDEQRTFTTLGRDVAGTTTTAVGTTSSSRPAPEPGTVEIVDFEFTPREITVEAGERVTWRNDDPYGHWVVGTEPDVLDSGELSQAQTYGKTFSQPGTYLYYCNIHNYMKGTVTVR
jgi:plastocyanin